MKVFLFVVLLSYFGVKHLLVETAEVGGENISNGKGKADPKNGADCPKKDPRKGQCRWKGGCRYNRYCCCGECYYTTIHYCHGGQIMTAVMDPPCDCLYDSLDK